VIAPVIRGKKLTELDMVIDPEDCLEVPSTNIQGFSVKQKTLDDSGACENKLVGTSTRQKRHALPPNSNRYWENNVVPYTLPSFFGESESHSLP